jgi:protein TonB
LVVYEKGQLVYRWNPEGSTPPQSAPIYMSPETAAGYVIHRVEPTYPDTARQRQIAGSVVLDAIIGRDGLVRELKDVSGNPQLVEAALSAVRQWKFKPYSPAGTPVEFRTSITLDFTLP